MTADLKSLIHGMSAAQVATAQAAHDARQPEIERLRGALTQIETILLSFKHTNELSASGKRILEITSAALAKAGR